MNLINEKEIGRLLCWASENGNKDVFLVERDQKESFWKTKDRQDTYIMEYDFKSILDFERVCSSVCEKEISKEIQRIISVAAFKHSKDCEQGQVKKKGEELPEHIYVF